MKRWTAYEVASTLVSVLEKVALVTIGMSWFGPRWLVIIPVSIVAAVLVIVVVSRRLALKER